MEKPKPQLITRFAPSPTGSIHLGSLRTAIFNWAFARKHGGTFLLRIDDSDNKRNITEAINQIYDGLKWMGLDWDAEFHQSQRQVQYGFAANYLLDTGAAYKCYCQDEVCKCKDSPPQNLPFCIKLNSAALMLDFPLEFEDLVLGYVQHNEVPDLVLMRSNGDAMYNLACVVDDHALGVTHVIRGQEHLTNTFAQLLIYFALIYTPPKFAHIPLILAPGSNKKLSKRAEYDMPVTLEEYQQQGYLPEVMFNYLTHLGWALDDKTEIWDVKEFVDNFCIKDVLKKPAAFDPQKLFWMQGHYMRHLSVEQKVAMYSGQNPETAAKVIAAAGDRLVFMSELSDPKYSHFIQPEMLDEIQKTDDAKDLAAGIRLEVLNDLFSWLADWMHSCTKGKWDAATIRDYTERFIKKRSAKFEGGTNFKEIVHLLRVTTTAQSVGLGVFEGMEILGRDECLGRMAYYLPEQPPNAD